MIIVLNNYTVYMRKYFLLLLFLLAGFITMAQTGVAVNTSGADPDNSAILDVASTDRGMLVPRMTSANRLAIANPANGLLVYDTDSLAFYYHDNQVWNKVANQRQLGSTTDYAKFEDDGTLIFYGNSTTFEDLQVPGLAMGLKRNDNSPLLATFVGGLDLYAFSYEGTSGNEKEVFFTVQIPHGWKEGSTIYPHVHFSTIVGGGGAAVTWGLEYTWASVDQVFSSTTETVTATKTISSNAQTHQVVGFGLDGIKPTTNQDKISSILICRLFRNSSATTDNFNNDVFLIAFDVHYEVNTTGSRTEWVK